MAGFNISFGREDILILIFLVGVLGAAAIMGYTSGSEPKPPGYCAEWASAAQNNLSQQYGEVSCECVPGDRYEKRVDPPEKVEENAELNFVSCEFKDREKLLFPVWRVNESKVLRNQSAGVLGRGS